MSKNKAIKSKNPRELAKILDLTSSDAMEMKVRSSLNSKIIEIVKKEKITHAKVAKMAKTSRSRVTAILNRNTKDISTDLLLRILGALGYTAEMKYKKAAA
jgi:predicted XRE-type DNA-binding protein